MTFFEPCAPGRTPLELLPVVLEHLVPGREPIKLGATRRVPRDPERHNTSKMFHNAPTVFEQLLEVSETVEASTIRRAIPDVDLQKFIQHFSLSAFDRFIRERDDSILAGYGGYEEGETRFRWQWPADTREVLWCVLTHKVEILVWCELPLGNPVRIYTTKEMLISGEVERYRKTLEAQMSAIPNWRALKVFTIRGKEGQNDRLADAEVLKELCAQYSADLELPNHIAQILAAKDELAHGRISWVTANRRLKANE